MSRSKIAIKRGMNDQILGLAPGSKVAVVTLLGSLCPVTLCHVQAFVEARRLLSQDGGDEGQPRENAPARDRERFDLVLGFISLNGDSYLQNKLRRRGEGGTPLMYEQRSELVRLAIADHEDWMGLEDREGRTYENLKKAYPRLDFVHYRMNGADDVLRYRKWRYARDDNRFITMGRPGDTEELKRELRKATWVDPRHFLMGPELGDASSTRAREALERGDAGGLEGLLDPRVADWCLENMK